MRKQMRRHILSILELLSNSILPILFWTSLIFGFDTPYIAILTIICAILHEIGHYLLIIVFSNRHSALKPHTSGFRIKRAERLSYEKEIAILIGGPMVNLILAALTLPFGALAHGYIRTFGFINLITGISNLLPFEGYDGYGAIKELLLLNGKTDSVKRLAEFSFILSVVIIFLSLYFIERYGEGYWIFGLFFVTSLSKLLNFDKQNVF